MKKIANITTGGVPLGRRKSANTGASGSNRKPQSSNKNTNTNNQKQYEQRTKSTNFKIGGKKVFSREKKFDGKTVGERVHDYRMEKLNRETDPAVVAEREKTKRALGYGGAAAASANSAASAAKQTVILAEGGINPTTPEPLDPDKDQNQYSWGGS